MAEIPQDLRYTDDHEWIKERDDGTVRIGVTAHATEQLGDIVYVSLPTVGAQVVAGDACAELESTKSVSDVLSPVTGTVTAINEALADAPEAINAEPYGDGWLFEVRAEDGEATAELLDAAAYEALLV